MAIVASAWLLAVPSTLLAQAKPNMQDIKVDSLRPHPRLFVSPERLKDVKERIATDGVSRKIHESLTRLAAELLDVPPEHYEVEGRRLLAVSRTCLRRIGVLSLVALLNDDDRAARRAIDEMLAIAAFPDWNPSHFLDTGEMALAMAIGYDWLYDRLSADERARIRTAIIELGLKPSLVEPEPGWVRATNNWNAVCHAGMAAGALAVAEDEPAMAQRIVVRAIRNLPASAGVYAPDGAYGEGPMYWSYGTSFHVVLIDLLASTLGSSFGLADLPGFRESATYYVQMVSPRGQYYNYSDCNLGGRGELEPALLWFAATADRPELITTHLRQLDAALQRFERKPAGADQRLTPFALLWHRPLPAGATDAPTPLPLHYTARGETPVSVHRSAWNDANAAFAGIKGGSPNVSHAHMDIGSFVIEADNVRWAIDPGMQDYHSIEQLGMKLWDKKPDADRWKIFRIGPHGHGILRFDDAQQHIRGNGHIVRFSGDGDMPHTVVDLSGVYPAQTSRVLRGLAMLPGRHVLLQDEWTANADVRHVTWQMLTTADVEIGDKQVVLRQDGKQMRLDIDCRDAFTIESTEAAALMQPFDAPNPNTRMIRIRLAATKEQPQTLRVLFTPGSTEAEGAFPLERSVLDWSAAR